MDFHSHQCRNAIHQSTTDPDARLYKKAQCRDARLGYLGHLLIEHRSGLIVRATVTPATGYGEREAAVEMIVDLPAGYRVTVAADQGYDTRDFIADLRGMGVTSTSRSMRRPSIGAAHRWPNDAAPGVRHAAIAHHARPAAGLEERVGQRREGRER